MTDMNGLSKIVRVEGIQVGNGKASAMKTSTCMNGIGRENSPSPPTLKVVILQKSQHVIMQILLWA